MIETYQTQLLMLLVLMVVTVIVGVILGILAYGCILWYRWRDREQKSLGLVTLLIMVPQENEVKIDAMEPIIASFGSLFKSARFKFLQWTVAQPSLSLEIIGNKDDIRFYISCPKKYQDMIEKQIYSVFFWCLYSLK